MNTEPDSTNSEFHKKASSLLNAEYEDIKKGVGNSKGSLFHKNGGKSEKAVEKNKLKREINYFS